MDISESKDFLVHTASLKEVRTFSRNVFDKLNLNNDLKDELVLAIAEAGTFGFTAPQFSKKRATIISNVNL